MSGIEGNFRNTAQISMRVLRENKDSLMAVLEAFVYDPLISWRLTAGQEGHVAGKLFAKHTVGIFTEVPQKRIINRILANWLSLQEDQTGN